MKKNLPTIVVAGVLAMFCAPLFGQQMPWFSAYTFQPKFYNPAAQGGASGGGVAVAYRSQFADLPTGSRPVSYLLQADISPLLGDRIGLGIMAMQDEVHITKRTNVTAFFGYHLFPVDNDFNLSLGVMAGLLNQRMDLSTATVNNPFDLTLMQAAESKSQFDGGFGLQARFAGLQLDVTLPQLFTSNLEYAPAGEVGTVRFDVFPHLFTSLRYRFQGEGFAIEPGIVYREVFTKALKAGNFDFGLRAYFLDDDRIMVGAGYRTDEGGLQFSAGVRPVPQVLLFGAYETHDALGSSFEAGVQYAFGKGSSPADDTRTTDTPKPQKPPKPQKLPKFDQAAESMLAQYKTTAETARQKAGKDAVAAREKIEIARYALNEAKSTNSHKTRQAKIANAEKYFPEIETIGAGVSIEAGKAVAAQKSADSLVQQVAARNQKVHNGNDLALIRTASSEASRNDTDVRAKFAELKILRSSLPALLDINDPATIQNYLGAELSALPNKPEDVKVVAGAPNSIAVQYADAEEAYKSSAKIKLLADWLGARVQELKAEGLVFETARLSAEILYNNVDTRTDARYASDYGQPFKTAYKLNGKDKTANIKKDAALTLETLAVLKLHDLKRYLAAKIGVPEDKITLELTAPNPKNDYQQVTRIVVNYRKP